MLTPAVIGNGVTSWSFSRYNDYKKCPALFKYKVIMKMKEPPNAAMERGSAIHKLAEDFTLGKIKTLPTELKLFKAEFNALKKQKVKVVEDSWTWTKDWAGETTWNDWAGAWLRVKMDVGYINVEHNVGVPIDHKTGKMRPDKTAEYDEQLHLYALSMLLKYPSLDAVSPRLWYLDSGEPYYGPDGEEQHITQAEVPKMKKVWLARIKPMFTDKQFKPTPGDACRWCHFRKSNSGPCQY